MESTWYVVADASWAKIYKMTEGKLILIKQLYHKESRLKRSELISDRGGLFRNGNGGGGEYAARSDFKEIEKQSFAKELTTFLEEARKKNQFQQLVWISLAHFYGLATKQMNTSLRQHIFQHIDKNYLNFSTTKLAKLIAEEQWWHWKAA